MFPKNEFNIIPIFLILFLTILKFGGFGGTITCWNKVRVCIFKYLIYLYIFKLWQQRTKNSSCFNSFWGLWWLSGPKHMRLKQSQKYSQTNVIRKIPGCVLPEEILCIRWGSSEGAASGQNLQQICVGWWIVVEPVVFWLQGWWFDPWLPQSTCQSFFEQDTEP